MIGTLLIGGSVALAAIGSTLTFVVKTLSEIEALNAILAIASVVLAIALLSGFLGWLKLRARDLSVLLEACGWALNGRMYLTRRLSLLFTQEPELPEGSKTELPVITSRYIVATEKRAAAKRRKYIFRTFLVVLLVAVAVYWHELYALILAQLQPPG